MAHTATWDAPLSYCHVSPPGGVRLCCIVQCVVQACTATTLEGDCCSVHIVLARIANESCDSCRAGATTSPLIIILCSQHTAFLLFCVGTHCERVMRLMPCGGYDKSSYYYFVFSTHCFLLFVLARFANESCDSCRAGATTSPLIIILCSQHTAFYYLCWHALPTSHATHAVRGLRQVLLLLFCVLNTLLFIICVGTLCQRVMRLMPCGGYDKSSYYYFVFATHRFLLFTSSLIIILCLQHTAFLLFPPFLLARNVTVRGSRYSCCLGHRLLFPYMILFKLYICCKKKNNIGLSLTQASVVVPSKVIQAQVCSTRVRETNPGLGLNFQEILGNPQQLGALHIYQSTPLNQLIEAAAPSSID